MISPHLSLIIPSINFRIFSCLPTIHKHSLSDCSPGGVHCMAQMDTFHSADCLSAEYISVIHWVLLVVSNMSFRLYSSVCTIWLGNCNLEAINCEDASQMMFQMNEYSW